MNSSSIMNSRKQPQFKRFESKLDRKAKVAERKELRQKKESAYLNTFTEEEQDDTDLYLDWYEENRG